MDTVTKDKALVKAKPKTPTRRKRKTPTELGRLLLKDLRGYIIDQKMLLTFIKDSLVEGVDYGYSWEGAKKKNIYKAGCEKVRIYSRCLDKPFVDYPTWEMIGKPANTLFFIVYLVPMARMEIVHKYIKEYGVENEELAWRENSVSIGRGAASTSEGKVKDANTCVKKGKKRAFMDAILNLGLSGEFEAPPEDGDNGQEEEQPRALPEEKEEIPPEKTAAAARQDKLNEKEESMERLKSLGKEIRKLIIDNTVDDGGPYSAKAAEFLYNQVKALYKSKDLDALKRQKMTIENTVQSFRKLQNKEGANE